MTTRPEISAKSSRVPDPGHIRWALALEYLGSAGSGWQGQRCGRAIADQLVHALEQICSTPIRTVAAGRTDAGVHALHQVVHFDLPADCNRSAKAWLLGVNRLLKPQIRVHWVRRVLPEFHARFSACSRAYAYLICNRAILPASWHNKVALEANPLDIEAMQQAADLLKGEHDFAAFRSSNCSSKTSVRKVHRLQVVRKESLVCIEIQANAFLQRMVRIITGCLWQVGLNRMSPDTLRDILLSRDRSRAADTAVAQGLYFLGPQYPPRFGVPPAPDIQSPLLASR